MGHLFAGLLVAPDHADSQPMLVKIRKKIKGLDHQQYVAQSPEYKSQLITLDLVPLPSKPRLYHRRYAKVLADTIADAILHKAS